MIDFAGVYPATLADLREIADATANLDAHVHSDQKELITRIHQRVEAILGPDAHRLYCQEEAECE